MGAISRPELRRFGLLVGTILMGLAAYRAWHVGWGSRPLVTAAVGVSMIGLGAIAPGLLKPVFAVWQLLGSVLGWVNTRILLALVFFIVLTPLALLARLMGHDPLVRKSPKLQASFWKERKTDRDAARYRQQF